MYFVGSFRVLIIDHGLFDSVNQSNNMIFIQELTNFVYFVFEEQVIWLMYSVQWLFRGCNLTPDTITVPSDPRRSRHVTSPSSTHGCNGVGFGSSIFASYLADHIILCLLPLRHMWTVVQVNDVGCLHLPLSNLLHVEKGWEWYSTSPSPLLLSKPEKTNGIYYRFDSAKQEIHLK